MIIYIIYGLIFLLILLIILILKNNPHKYLIKKIKTLSLYVNKNLSLDECYIFIELLREVTVELIELNKENHFPKELHEITNILLGYVLSIPRVEESSSNSLTEAIQQIDKLMTTSQEAQNYLRTHLDILVKIVSHSARHKHSHYNK
ncbi:MAG: hypothetical protein ACRCTJ_04515 [Brevinema sp.]